MAFERFDIGQWAIDPSELFRGFPALALPATNETARSPQIERDATADVLVAELRQVIALRRGQDDLRQERDKWQRPMSANKPRTPPRNASWYPARNAYGTGCNGGRGGRTLLWNDAQAAPAHVALAAVDGVTAMAVGAGSVEGRLGLLGAARHVVGICAAQSPVT